MVMSIEPDNLGIQLLWAADKLKSLTITTPEVAEPLANPSSSARPTSLASGEIYFAIPRYQDSVEAKKPDTDQASRDLQGGDNMSMTREELMAHLDAQQARTETMLARQNADTVGHLARFEAQMDRGLAQMQVDRQDQKDEARSVRWTMITSTLAIFLALVGTIFAIVSLNSSVVGNVISSFQAGQALSAPTAPHTPPANEGSPPK
jgi:hypothetical protein